MTTRLPWVDYHITRIAGICGIFLPVVIFSCIWVSIAVSPWFSWTRHALSDLGIVEQSAVFFNNGMILGGILAFIFSLGLMKVVSNRAGAYLLAGSSVALIGIGVFPETVMHLHFITSASFFALLILALFFIGLTLRQTTVERRMGMTALCFGILGVSAIVVLFPFEYIALIEAFCCFPAFVWCLFVGSTLVRG